MYISCLNSQIANQKWDPYGVHSTTITTGCKGVPTWTVKAMAMVQQALNVWKELSSLRVHRGKLDGMDGMAGTQSRLP